MIIMQPVIGYSCFAQYCTNFIKTVLAWNMEKIGTRQKNTDTTPEI